jgi:hypothetical protein
MAVAALVGTLFRRHEPEMDVISGICIDFCADKLKEDCPSMFLSLKNLQNEIGAQAVSPPSTGQGSVPV